MQFSGPIQSVRNFGGSHGGPMGGSHGGSHVRIPKVGGGPMLESQKLGGPDPPNPCGGCAYGRSCACCHRCYVPRSNNYCVDTIL